MSTQKQTSFSRKKQTDSEERFPPPTPPQKKSRLSKPSWKISSNWKFLTETVWEASAPSPNPRRDRLLRCCLLPTPGRLRVKIPFYKDSSPCVRLCLERRGVSRRAASPGLQSVFSALPSPASRSSGLGSCRLRAGGRRWRYPSLGRQSTALGSVLESDWAGGSSTRITEARGAPEQS